MDDKDKKKQEEVEEDVAAAIAAGIILHRCGPGVRIALYGKGLHHEDSWGRASRAGAGAGIPHRIRRD